MARLKKEGRFVSITTVRLDRSRESACGLYDMLENTGVRRGYLTYFWMIGNEKASLHWWSTMSEMVVFASMHGWI